MQFKNVVAFTAIAAVASAASNSTASNGTSTSNGTSSNTTSSAPSATNSENAALQHFVNAGAMGAVVAGGMALVL